MSTAPLFKLGGFAYQKWLTVTEAEVIYQHQPPMHFKKKTYRYPIAGAKATLDNDVSGWRGQRNTLSITFEFANGEVLPWVQTIKGAIGRATLAEWRGYVAKFNAAASKATD